MTRLDSAGDDDALDAVLQDAVGALRSPVAPSAAARDALTSALRGERAAAMPAAPVAPRQLRAARSRWLTTPFALRASPLTMLAAATVLVAATSVITARITRGAEGDGAPGRAQAAGMDGAPQIVRFTLAAPQARRVSLVGDFNGWDPAATTLQNKDGMWTVVIPVSAGRHQYGFVIDGSEWIADPAAAQSADADFGTQNSVMYVGG
jgi:hypothetical protein